MGNVKGGGGKLMDNFDVRFWKHNVEQVMEQLKKMEARMSVITDLQTRLLADFSKIGTSIDDLVSAIGVLNQKITDMQNSPGTLSASDQAALDAIQAAADDVTAKASAADTATATAPAAAPAPVVAPATP